MSKVLKIIDVMSSAGLLTNTQILLLNPIPRGLSIKDYTETHRKTPGSPSEFESGDTKLERFLPKNQHTQRKLLNLRIGVVGRCQKSPKI